MKQTTLWLAILLLLFANAEIAHSFCGFYVAKADTKIFNKASQVVLTRQDDKTVITMVNDFKGDPKEFAVVIPVPTLIERGQINVGDKKIVDHLDAYTSPRLVEYYDGSPCQLALLERRMRSDVVASQAMRASARAAALGVTVQAQYTVGEYDIVILSAKQGEGLETWLKENGYRLPKGASEVLGSYIKQKMHFFVARVNLQEQSKLGFSYLRPIQVAYESPKFMLPLRLGTLNADGYQELFIYALTSKGRVEPTNYRSVKLPTGMDLPIYIKGKFKDFYRSMFDRQVQKADMRAVFTEYAWDMNWCDPCAADPLSTEDLRSLGVFWLDDARSPVVPAPRLLVFGVSPAAQALASARVTSNCICPGAVDTAMWEQIDRELAALEGLAQGEVWKRRIRGIPLGRPEKAEDVASVVAFLAGPDSDYMTGQAINVDGGMVMGN